MALELKLKEVVSNFGSTLSRKHKHLVPAYGDREVAARRGNFTTLIDLMDTKTERQTWTMTKSFWVFNFKCCSLLLWKWMKHASSQHACSRSCRLMVHMSFNLYVGEIVTKVMHKNKYICRKWNKKFIHTWHFHHNRQISRVYHCRLWPHVQIWPLASWNRDAGFLGLVSNDNT